MGLKYNLSRPYTERIHDVIDYISTHLSEEITLETLASVACFSPFHFHRIFSAFTGETPRGYIERQRMETAANRLCTAPDKSVTAIASECGFSTVSAFSRTFKKYYQIPPSQFLAQHINDFHSKDVVSINSPDLPHSRRMVLPVKIERLPPLHILYIQTLIGYADGIPKAWDKLIQYAQINNFFQSDTRLLGIPYDNPDITPRKKCRYRACITVPGNIIRKRGDFKTNDLAAGVYAVFHFKGKRQDITDAYAFVYGEWLPKSGFIPNEKPLLEIYPSDMFNNPTIEILEYDIALPIVSL